MFNDIINLTIMKRESKNILFIVILLITALAVLNGCESRPHVSPNLNPHKYGRIFMPQARKYPAKYSITLHPDSTWGTIYSATYGGPQRKSGDINLQFTINSALVDSFNAKNSTSYSILPKDSYELSKTEAVIHSGELSTPKLKLKINENSLIQETKFQYLLPLTVKERKGEIKLNKELQTTYYLIQISYPQIDKSSWSIHKSDAGDKSSYQASNLIDNDDLGTFAYWPSTDPNHYVSVDMGGSHTLHGFKIIARGQPGGDNYRLYQDPKKITIQFSSDGKNWRDGEDFTLPIDLQTRTAKIYLSTGVKARYFKIIIRTTVGNKKTPNFNEIYAF